MKKRYFLALLLAFAFNDISHADEWSVDANTQDGPFGQAQLKDSFDKTWNYVRGQGNSYKGVKDIFAQMDEFNRANPLTARSPECTTSGNPARRAALNACRSDYQRLYSGSQINIPIFLGYMDTKNCHPYNRGVLDRAIAATLTETLREPCHAGQDVSACGFSRTPQRGPDDFSSVLTKVITGPDGQPKTVRITIRYSSLTSDDETNRGNTGPSRDAMAANRVQQNYHSGQMERAFQESLHTADAVFYLGHARYGCGPDFSPPPMTIKSDGTRVETHGGCTAANPGRGVRLMTEGLAQRHREGNHKPAIVSVFACDSDGHFRSALQTAAADPHLGLTTLNGVSSMAQNARSTIASLDGLIGMRCNHDYQSSLDASRPKTIVDPHHPETVREPRFESSGFFN